jgi:hypothetical protein
MVRENAYRNSVRKPEERRSLATHMHRWHNNMNE